MISLLPLKVKIEIINFTFEKVYVFLPSKEDDVS